MSLRDQILAATDVRHEDVAVQEWGVTVRVRTLPGSEIGAWTAAHVDAGGKPREREDRLMQIFLICVVDPETNQPLFSEADLPALRSKSAAALTGLVGVALRLNGAQAKN